MNDNPDFSALRRRLLLALGALPAAGRAAPAAPSRQPVVVLTSYNDEVFSRFEAAFEKTWPQYRLQLVWRMPHDALPTLRQPRQSGIDVYWSASPRNFASLAAEGAWQALAIDRDGLPGHVGRARLADAEGYYAATEMAGYGFIVNPAELARLGLAVPQDWSELAAPAWSGRIALPDPGRVGFAPVMVDIVLQAYGWERGWAVWSAIAGNAGSVMEAGSTFVTDEVASGRCPLGLSIDFFSAAAIANGAPLRFAYPAHSGINPAHIAICRDAPNPDGARAFADFVLSAAGQRLITHRDIRKLPVRPAVYRELPADYFDPFRAAERGVFDYDGDATRDRLGLVAALFAQTLTREHGELAGLWRRVHRAEAAGRDVGAVRRQLEAPPLSAAEAADPALLAPFRDRREAATAPAANALEAQWQQASRARRGDIARRLDRMGA